MQTESMGRDKLFTIRMTEEERERAERVSKSFGLNVAGVIRMLLKEKDDELRRLELDPNRVGGSKLDGARMRGAVEEATGVCFACPTYFRAAIAEAQGPGGKYADAGWTFAIHAEDFVQGPESEGALKTALASDDAPKAVLEWMRTYVPRCFDLVPPKRAAAFRRGIEKAIEEGRL